MSTKREWLDSTYKKGQERPVRFSTVSDLEIEPLYTPEDMQSTQAFTREPIIGLQSRAKEG